MERLGSCQFPSVKCMSATLQLQLLLRGARTPAHNKESERVRESSREGNFSSSSSSSSSESALFLTRNQLLIADVLRRQKNWLWVIFGFTSSGPHRWEGRLILLVCCLLRLQGTCVAETHTRAFLDPLYALEGRPADQSFGMR